MKIQDWFENWGITGLQVNAGFLRVDWKPQPEEQQAAWELYIELITRIATQPLPDGEGDEKTALESVCRLFDVTRELLKAKGRKAETFSKIAIIILNQKVRPFTAKWHKKSLHGEFAASESCVQFRKELEEVQKIMRNYAALLAKAAGVEDFQKLEQGPLQSL